MSKGNDRNAITDSLLFRLDYSSKVNAHFKSNFTSIMSIFVGLKLKRDIMALLGEL